MSLGLIALLIFILFIWDCETFALGVMYQFCMYLLFLFPISHFSIHAITFFYSVSNQFMFERSHWFFFSTREFKRVSTSLRVLIEALNKSTESVNHSALITTYCECVMIDFRINGYYRIGLIVQK